MTMPGYSEIDTDDDGKVSNAELMAAIESNPKIEESIKNNAASKIKDALLNIDNPSYNENITKKLLNDFLTNKQRQMFYGGDSETYKTLVPDGGRKNYYKRNIIFLR